MGNILRGFFNSERRRRIRVMKVDGTMMKLWRPVYVKEIVGNLHDHGVFEADVVRRLGIHSPPLPERAELRAGRLYYLIPLPHQPSPVERPSSDKTLAAASRRRRLQQFRTAFSNRDSTAGEFDRGARIVSSVDDGSSLRVKLRVRKDELDKLLSGDGKSVVEELGGPVTEQGMEKESGGSFSRSPRFGWKPSLDSITEYKNPTSDVGGQS